MVSAALACPFCGMGHAITLENPCKPWAPHCAAYNFNIVAKDIRAWMLAMILLRLAVAGPDASYSSPPEDM